MPGAGSPGSMAADPQAKFVYIYNFGAIDRFAIDATTGSLTAVPGSSFPGYFGIITISPNGRFLFATDTGTIWAFTVDPLTGTLMLVAGSPFPVPVGDPISPSFSSSLVVEPSSSFVYTVGGMLQHGGGDLLTFVFGFSIDAATGALNGISDPSYFYPGNNLSLYAIAVSGSFVYASNDQGVIAFSIAPGTGVLTQVNGSPYPPGTASGGIVISPDGKCLFQAVNTYGMLDTGNIIDAFTLDPSTGAASSSDSVTTPTGPFILNIATR